MTPIILFESLMILSEQRGGVNKRICNLYTLNFQINKPDKLNIEGNEAIACNITAGRNIFDTITPSSALLPTM